MTSNHTFVEAKIFQTKSLTNYFDLSSISYYRFDYK